MAAVVVIFAGVVAAVIIYRRNYIAPAQGRPYHPGPNYPGIPVENHNPLFVGGSSVSNNPTFDGASIQMQPLSTIYSQHRSSSRDQLTQFQE
jgi:hypothetical protein